MIPYQSSSSKNFTNSNKNISIEYVNTSVNGTKCSDLVGLNKDEMVPLDFLLATKLEKKSRNDESSGLIGLSPIKYPNFSLIEKLCKNNVTANRMFVFHFGTSFLNPAYLEIGEMSNKADYEKAQYSELVLNNYGYYSHWNLNVHMSYKGKNMSHSFDYGTIDSGSPFILMPQKDLDNLLGNITEYIIYDEQVKFYYTS